MTGFTASDYAAAAAALCAAISLDAKVREESGSSRWKALLEPIDFHEKTFDLALSIAVERQTYGPNLWPES